MTAIIIILLFILIIEKTFEPRINWNYETERLMLWYNFKNQRKFIQL